MEKVPQALNTPDLVRRLEFLQGIEAAEDRMLKKYGTNSIANGMWRAKALLKKARASRSHAARMRVIRSICEDA